MTSADDCPRWARIAHAGAMLELALLAAAWSWLALREEYVGPLFCAALCAIALAGLWRRVAWGRFLFSAVSLILAAGVSLVLIPNLDDVYEGGPVFVRVLGFMPPNAICWLIIMTLVVLVLLPALAIGWRKHWFRSAAW